jgi:Leucine-rich repeat (LRR) protein
MYTSSMNKKSVLILIVVVFIASGLFYRQIFQSKSDNSNNVKTVNLIPEGTVNPASNNLNLSNQGLTKLPEYVTGLTDLEVLNISNNKISGALPSQMQKLQKLKVLSASNNLMTGVPAEIGQLKNLEVLDLSNNQLTGLPNELANLKKLKTFNISGNNYSQQDLDTIKKGLPSSVQIIL